MKERAEFLIGISGRSQNYSAIEPIALPHTKHMADDELLRNFHRKLVEEFPFLNNYLPLSDTESDAVYGIFQWLSAQLLEVSSTVALAPLLQVLLVGAELSWGSDQLWKEIKTIGPIRNSRLQELKQLIALRQFSFSDILHIGHHRSVQVFQEACEQYDWPGVDELFHHIDGLLYDAPLSNAASALSTFSPSEFESAFVEMRDVASILTVLRSTHKSNVKHLGIAARHDNLPLKFCAFYCSTEEMEPEAHLETEQLQAAILSQVAKNSDEWHKWMMVFNRYPSRYPTVQRPFGRALCTMSKTAVDQYFDVVQLANFKGRFTLAVAFEAANCNAEIYQKQVIWTAAFEKWNTWCFNKNDNQRPMISVETSAIDVAVSAYYRDCVSAQDQEAVEAEFHAEFLQIQSAWYEKITDYLKAIYRHLSRYQPFAHGRLAQLSDKQWIEGQSWYFPPWISDNSYWKIRSHLQFETASDETPH
jgi:hypothetical protein